MARRFEDEDDLKSALFSRCERVPDSGGKQNYRAGAGEKDEKRRRQHEPRHNGRRRGQSTAKITIKRARFEALHAFLEEQLHRAVILREAGGAFI